MKKLFSFAPFFIAALLVGCYLFFCWIVYLDRTLRDFPAIQFHSGSYYSKLAGKLQYRPHEPDEVETCYNKAIENAPADSEVFLSYFHYLSSQNCCGERAALLIAEALRRNPNSPQMYPHAILYAIQKGQKKEASALYIKAMEMRPDNLRDVFSLLVQRKIPAADLVQVMPRNSQSLSLLAQFLSKMGPDYRDLWIETVRELYSFPVEPAENLKTAEEAIRLRDEATAMEYLERALRYPETENRARNLMNKIYKKKRDR